MITKTIIIAFAALAAIGLAPIAAAAPASFAALGCTCRETHPAGSSTLKNEIEVGVQEGQLVTYAELHHIYSNFS